MKKILCGLMLCATPLTFSMITEAEKTSIEWGLSDRQGRRPTMEDAYVHDLIDVGTEKSCAFFGLFDGHGGIDAAQAAAQHVATCLSKEVQSALGGSATLDEALKSGLKTACTQIDHLLQKDYANQGTTALMAILADRLAYLAWVGDSRALILSQDGTIKASTGDHKPDSPCELERVGSENVMVQYLVQGNHEQFIQQEPMGKPLHLSRGQKIVKRVARLGSLSLSRSLGDKTRKDTHPMITGEPGIQLAEVAEGDYLILACDGLWDVMSNERVAAFVADRLLLPIEELRDRHYNWKPSMIEPQMKDAGSSERLRLIAAALRNKAYDLKSDDNISVIIIKI